jgi:hypothetical protein
MRVPTRAELVDLANGNFVASFAKLAEHSAAGEVREFGGVLAFVTGHPVSLFNGCVVLEASRSGQLDDALEWVRGRRVPYRVWIAETLVGHLGAVARRAGLERSCPLSEYGPPPGLRVTEALGRREGRAGRARGVRRHVGSARNVS